MEDLDSEMEEISLKILLVGDSSVGKTSILLRYTEDEFPDKYLSTISVDFHSKIFEFRGFKVQLQIYDTVGQEKFRSLTTNFFHNSDGIFFVFDITNQNSFTGVQFWIKDSEKIEDSFKKILIGNKCDLKHIRKVSEEEVNNYCEKNQMDYFETSAKEDINIKEAFEKIIELIFKDKSDEEIRKLYSTRKSILSTLTKTEKAKKGRKCC